MSRGDPITCYLDSTIMETDELIPGHVRCDCCGLFAELVDHNAEAFRELLTDLVHERLRPTLTDYEVDPDDGSAHPWGHLAPKVHWGKKPKLKPESRSENGPIKVSNLKDLDSI